MKQRRSSGTHEVSQQHRPEVGRCVHGSPHGHQPAVHEQHEERPEGCDDGGSDEEGEGLPVGEEEEAGARLDHHGEGAAGGGQLNGRRENTTAGDGMGCDRMEWDRDGTGWDGMGWNAFQIIGIGVESSWQCSIM